MCFIMFFLYFYFSVFYVNIYFSVPYIALSHCEESKVWLLAFEISWQLTITAAASHCHMLEVPQGPGRER